jgi:hypothetical protein
MKFTSKLVTCRDKIKIYAKFKLVQLAQMQTLSINVSPHFDQGFMEKILSELNADLL